MKKIHAKSPCCHGRIIKFGSRRRQCVICRRTWTLRKRKRGRREKRRNHLLLKRYLDRDIASLSSINRSSSASIAKASYHLRKSLADFVARYPWETIPKSKRLIASADAMTKRHYGEFYSVYFILVKDISEQEAVVIKPCILKGRESAPGWKRAFARLPKKTLSSIKVVVSDGHKGILKEARRYGWLVQRCHFHLISSFQGRRSQSRYSLHREEGKRLYKAALKVITSSDKKLTRNNLKVINQMIPSVSSPRFRSMLNGFLKDYDYFRTYLTHPELNIPTTSNSVESLISGARELCHRARGFKTLRSLKLWLYAYAKNKKTIVCNGHLPTK